MCTLFLDPQWRKEGNGYLLSKSRFLFMAAFRERFNEKVVAEMRGVIDEQGYSPFWGRAWANAFSPWSFPVPTTCAAPDRRLSLPP
ncbi:arginine N-succinyltransferase [Klebsiella pneumoniae]